MMDPILIGPAIAAVLLLGGWLVAQSRDQHGLPRRSLVGLGQWLAMAGLVGGLLALPTDLSPAHHAAALAGTLFVGLVLVRAAGRLAIGWTTTAEVITRAAALAWTRPVRVVWSVVCAGAGLSLAAWLAGRGEPLAGLLGTAVALAPVRWHLPAGYSRERATTGIERAMAGALAGGVEWEAAEANLRGAPVRARFDAYDRPSAVSAPLPPGWKAANEETLSSEINSRLSAWGTPWVAEIDHSRRRLVATKGKPLPDMVRYDGQRPQGMRLPLGLCRISPAAALAGVGRLGALVPFYWDAADSPSGLIVGSMGGGKSVLVRLIVTQWAGHIGPVRLLDPKRVEFSAFAGRQGVETVATSLTDIARVFAETGVEMQRRYALMERAGVQHVKDLEEPLKPILIVCDEYFELVAKNPGSDDQTKADNEVRAGCANSARQLAALGRAAGVHLILLAQRADAEVVKGSLQNNLLYRALLRPQSAGATARNMIDLHDVEPSGNPKGRAVMKTAMWPECEVQTYFLDAADLDRYLPKVAPPAKPETEPGQGQDTGEVEAVSMEAEPDQSDKKPSKKRESADRDPASDRTPDEEDSTPDSEDEPDPFEGLGFDPLEGFEDDGK